MKTTRLALLCLVLIHGLSAAHAQTITRSAYAGGENDTAPVNGGTVLSAVDLGSSGLNLPRAVVNNGVTWSSNASPGSADFAGGTASAWSYHFDGTNYLYTATAATTTTTHWAIEAWVNLDSIAGTQIFFLNGQGGNGYGLGLLSGNWIGLLGGIQFLNGPAATTGTWTHLAMVNDSGVTTFYVNGTDVAEIVSNAAPPGQRLVIGSDANGNNTYGYVDQARLFTFDAGTFSTANLNLTAIPEPATSVALAGLAALGLAWWRRRVAMSA